MAKRAKKIEPRKSNSISTLHKVLIVCEDSKSAPFYFNALKNLHSSQWLCCTNGNGLSNSVKCRDDNL
jgi:hypothetical protein